MPPRPPFPKARHTWLALAAAEPALQEPDAMSWPLGLAPTREAATLPSALSVDLAAPARAAQQCEAADGKSTPARCASSLEGREEACTQAAAAAREGEAVLLEGIDRWWRLGPDGAGFCQSCGAALRERLRESYGEHFERYDALAALRAKGAVRERPFGGLREELRLAEAVEAVKQTALRARDEARRQRGLELPILGRADALSPPALLLARHLDGLVFPLPSTDPWQCLLPLLAARAALGQRPAIALAPPEATEEQVRQLAALCTACDADLALLPAASRGAQTALGEHRRYLATMRERLKQAAPLADFLVLASPRADAWAGGAHFAAASLAAAAIARLHLQISVSLELPIPGPRTPLVMAGPGGLSPDEAQAARRHVADGGDLLLVAAWSVLDDEGRAVEKLFPEAKAGLNRSGEGRIWAITPDGEPPSAPQLEAQVARAARELLGRGRASLSLTGRGSLLVRGYLDPERKLDVHLVNLEMRDTGPVAAQGLTLHVAGQVAGGGRSGYWFAPDRDQGSAGERIALNAAGFGVSTVLPRLGGSALLTIPR